MRLTQAFLQWCDTHGSQQTAVDQVAAGREAGVPGLPAQDDWPEWDADEMATSVAYLDRRARDRELGRTTRTR